MRGGSASVFDRRGALRGACQQAGACASQAAKATARGDDAPHGLALGHLQNNVPVLGRHAWVLLGALLPGNDIDAGVRKCQAIMHVWPGAVLTAACLRC